ncbi:TonB-dependent receptor [Mucilaginibacter jinjuensis]|uniref:TonB-dependent receptor n=1 Tax=Mucilaginibacter jinjuensis TaxID=1176721 RepID=A0ABY7TAV5_9SPHI|nr:TonB-dependent receptor [Mucilaginibacter jinjuensis]WCT12863.1 TonB-dependent receptor [Mucilaginibacter jinjuensis]
MLRIKKASFLLLTILVSVTLFGFTKAGDDPIKKATTQLDKWVAGHPQEKVYLHFDKPYYTVGDNIWFKAYVTVGPRHQLTGLSGTLNVELIDSRDSIKQSIKLPLTAGLGSGDFPLSDTLAAGNYRIRAYTNWMRNAGPDYFFDKTIRIGNSANNTVFTKTDYAYATKNGQRTIKASINYANLNGEPYANKEVSYQTQINGKNAERGKGVTDGKGNLQIDFINNAAQFKQGAIVSHIKIDDKKTIVNTIPVNAIAGDVNIQFFPESGNMVNELPSKIAFKAVGADGLGKAINGTVVDNNGQEIAKLTTSHLGMGAFIMVPQAGQTYTAQVTFDDGSKVVLPLPKAIEQGYVLTVNNTLDPDNIAIRITASKELIGSEVGLVIHSGGDVCYATKVKLENIITAAKVSKQSFPSGIAQLTLFNSAGEAVNERIVFINNPDRLTLNIAPQQATFATRGKMKFDITAYAPGDKPALSSLSAAVIDESKVPVDESDETTILSSILLSSDIKGYIEKPNYYFADNNEQAAADLDLLMLTQGYRRFEWKQVMNDNFAPSLFAAERGIRVSGQVMDGKKPVVGGKVTLFNTQRGMFMVDTLTDENGRFSFDNLEFKDSVKFVVQARTAKNKKYVDVNLDKITRQQVEPNVNAPDMDVNIDNTMLTYLLSNSAFLKEEMNAGIGNHNILLKEVTIRETKKPILQTSSNLNGPGIADQVIKGDIFENTPCLNIIDCLAGRIAGVTFRDNKAYFGGATSISFDSPMQIIVDGIYVEPDFLATLNSRDVGSIEVLRSIGYTGLYGARGSAGVIVVNMKTGAEMGNYSKYFPGVVTAAAKGYYQARSFYSPQYNDPKINAALADLRSTIYWNPSVVADKDGKASIDFFNAGSKGNYRVVVEGIDSDGHIGRHVYHYKVE